MKALLTRNQKEWASKSKPMRKTCIWSGLSTIPKMNFLHCHPSKLRFNKSLKPRSRLHLQSHRSNKFSIEMKILLIKMSRKRLRYFINIISKEKDAWQSHSKTKESEWLPKNFKNFSSPSSKEMHKSKCHTEAQGWGFELPKSSSNCTTKAPSKSRVKRMKEACSLSKWISKWRSSRTLKLMKVTNFKILKYC